MSDAQLTDEAKAAANRARTDKARQTVAQNRAAAAAAAAPQVNPAVLDASVLYTGEEEPIPGKVYTAEDLERFAARRVSAALKAAERLRLDEESARAQADEEERLRIEAERDGGTVTVEVLPLGNGKIAD